jgi:general secretion pathway protein I
VSREHGFTLIEVLVALVILGVTAVAILQLFGGGLRLVGASAGYLDATLLASAKLSEAAAEEIEEGVTEGDEGAYRWMRRVRLDPDLIPLEPTQPEAATLRIARISIEVRWGKNRRVELETLRTWSVRP